MKRKLCKDARCFAIVKGKERARHMVLQLDVYGIIALAIGIFGIVWSIYYERSNVESSKDKKKDKE